jgi:hypothetical protein
MPARGAQVQLSGDAQDAARGGQSTTMRGNEVVRDATVSVPPIDTFPNGVAFPVGSTVTARAGGGQALGTVLTSVINNVGTVATAADSVVLDPMLPGEMVVVVNAGAASTQVFGTSPATINGVATATGVPLAAGKVGLYFAVSATNIRGGSLA